MIEAARRGRMTSLKCFCPTPRQSSSDISRYSTRYNSETRRFAIGPERSQEARESVCSYRTESAGPEACPAGASSEYQLSASSRR